MPSKITPLRPPAHPGSPDSAPDHSPKTGRSPIRTLRFGRISASIWENSSENGPFFSVTFARTYVDSAKQFQSADSFSRDDLPLVGKLADLAHTFIYERAAATRGPREPSAP